MDDKISIIVPVYKAEKTLTNCVDSLINQTYENIEIILVNDGSKDDSLKICNEYAKLDSRIIVVDKKNGGVSSARNAGLDIATGKFVMFCDSDDWVNVHWCENLLNNYVSESLLMCEIERKNKYEKKDIYNQIDENSNIDRVNKDKFLHFYERGIGLPTNKIFNLTIINDNNIRFPKELSLGEDLAFVINYLSCIKGDILLLHQNLYYYRESEQITLSKSVPSIEQCEYFYDVLTLAIENLNACDELSLSLRDSIIMNDYEKKLISLSRNKNYSFFDKLKIYQRIFNRATFSKCSKYGVNSSNKFYNWLIKKKHPLLLLIFYSVKK
jgi:glycosyltransferase involved in cell wall biosynthesis